MVFIFFCVGIALGTYIVKYMRASDASDLTSYFSTFAQSIVKEPVNNKALLLNALKKKPDYLLLDAVTIPDLDIKQFPIIKGDAKSISIAGASILAKVTRDRLMYKYDEIYPQYGFKHHKGYGTKEHYEAIEKYGITPIHRKSFLKNVL